ncbi:MAG: hypothetical protein AAF585_09995 [Verrucomicrobiota bacterium]
MAKPVRVDWGLIGHLAFSVFIFLCFASCVAGLMVSALMEWFPSISEFVVSIIHGILVTTAFVFLLRRAVQRYHERGTKPPSDN